MWRTVLWDGRVKCYVSWFLLLSKWVQQYYFYRLFSNENLGSLHLPCPISRHSFNVFQMKLFTYETENYNVYQINLYKYPSECSTYWFSTKAVSPVSVKFIISI